MQKSRPHKSWPSTDHAQKQVRNFHKIGEMWNNTISIRLIVGSAEHQISSSSGRFRQDARVESNRPIIFISCSSACHAFQYIKS